MLASAPEQISILAVVTEPEIQKQLVDALAEFQCHVLGSVKAALSHIFEADQVPDIILLKLPEQEARDFSSLIHEDRHLALIPILLIYEAEHLPAPDKVLAIGAADLVAYPFENQDLVDLLHKHELTRRGWWDTFHIEAPEKPERIMNALKLARSKGLEMSEKSLEQTPGDSFQTFRQLLYGKSGLTADRIKYLQPYTSEQLYELGSALYLDSLQISAALGEYLHLPVIENLEQLEVSLGAIPAAFCRKNRLLPLKNKKGQDLVAISNPFQLEVVDIVNQLFKSYQLVVAPPELIEEVLNPDFKNTEHWRQWMAIRYLRSSRNNLLGPSFHASAQQILPHKPLPKPSARKATDWQPANLQDASMTLAEAAEAQRVLDYFYRGSQVGPADENAVELPVAESLAPLAASPSDAAKAVAISNERQAQLMEQRLYRAYQAYREKKQQQEHLDTAVSLEKLIETESDPEVAPIIHLVNSLIEKAHHLRASDIHIEPRENEVVIRYRIDGLLRIVHRMEPRAIIKPIAARIKIMAQLDINERRLPQDGHVSFMEHSPGYDLSLRVATVPMAYGEKIVLRILDNHQSLLDLEEMGFSPEGLSLYRHLIRSPYGMILHVGPTGSGKTSTLYAALNEINDPEINIQTIENPIEYMLDGINQLEVRPEIGLDFARALRAYLRQDPDVILVGEIRDEETAHIAIETALTGHLLFSTLHTNDAAATIVRLMEMGLKPHLITSSLRLICAQRLLRKLCQNCRKPYPADEGVKHLLQLDAQANVTLYEPNGCEECSQTGYYGRVGVYEILVPNDEIRQLMNQPNVSSQEIKHAAVHHGMRTLFQEGVDKVLQGLTSLEEMTLQLLPDEDKAGSGRERLP